MSDDEMMIDTPKFPPDVLAEEIHKKSAKFRRFFWCKSSTFQEEGDCYMECVLFPNGTLVQRNGRQVRVHQHDSWEHAYSAMHSHDSYVDDEQSLIWLDN